MEITNDVRELTAREQGNVNGGESRFIPYLPVEPVWPYPVTPVGPFIPGFLEP